MQKDTLQLIIDNAILALGAANEPADNLNTGAIVVPESFKTVDLEEFMPKRRRFRGSYTTSDIEDFTSYAASQHEATVFIDTAPPQMSATAFFDLGDSDYPGHAEHRAKLALMPSPAYAAAIHFNGQRLKQGQLADFIEDWLPQLEIMHNDERQNPVQAIQAIRNITINASAAAAHSESHFGASRSAMEEIEAKSSVHKLPTHIKFTLTPHAGFEPITINFRIAVITDKEAPRLTLRWMQQELQQQEIGDNLKKLVTDALGNESYEIYNGSFSAN